MKPALYIAAAILECLGVVLLASPDLIPGAVSLAGRLQRLELRAENWLRRQLHQAPRYRVRLIEGATISGKSSLSASLTMSVDLADTIDRKVEWLLERDKATQAAIDGLNQRIAAFETMLSGRLDELRQTFEALLERRVTERLGDKRTARLWGVFFLIAGLGIGTWANLHR